jgi:hypothetical protein
MPTNLIPFPPPHADEHASTESERKRKLYAWATTYSRSWALLIE